MLTYDIEEAHNCHVRPMVGGVGTIFALHRVKLWATASQRDRRSRTAQAK